MIVNYNVYIDYMSQFWSILTNNLENLLTIKQVHHDIDMRLLKHAFVNNGAMSIINSSRHW